MISSFRFRSSEAYHFFYKLTHLLLCDLHVLNYSLSWTVILSVSIFDLFVSSTSVALIRAILSSLLVFLLSVRGPFIALLIASPSLLTHYMPSIGLLVAVHVWNILRYLCFQDYHRNVSFDFGEWLGTDIAMVWTWPCTPWTGVTWWGGGNLVLGYKKWKTATASTTVLTDVSEGCCCWCCCSCCWYCRGNISGIDQTASVTKGWREWHFLPQSRGKSTRWDAILVDHMATTVQRWNRRVDFSCTVRFAVSFPSYRIAIYGEEEIEEEEEKPLISTEKAQKHALSGYDCGENWTHSGFEVFRHSIGYSVGLPGSSI